MMMNWTRSGFLTQAVALGAILTGMTLMASSAPHELDATEMTHVRGGGSMWCSTPMPDADALDCDECTSNGNGGWVKCTTDAVNKKHQYVTSTPPTAAFMWNYTPMPCGGWARNYGNANCTGSYSSVSCGRMVTAAMRMATSTEVNCPPIP